MGLHIDSHLRKEYSTPRELGATSFRESLEIETEVSLLAAMDQGVCDRCRHVRDIVTRYTT